VLISSFNCVEGWQIPIVKPNEIFAIMEWFIHRGQVQTNIKSPHRIKIPNSECIVTT